MLAMKNTHFVGQTFKQLFFFYPLDKIVIVFSSLQVLTLI